MFSIIYDMIYLGILYVYLLFVTIRFIVYIYNIQRQITLYVVFPTKGKGGPYSLSNYVRLGILKWNKNKNLRKKAILIHKESLDWKSVICIYKNKYTYIWFERSNFLLLIKNTTYNEIFEKLLYGPIVTPINWFNMPRNNTYETYWCLVMKRIKAFVTHSNRVQHHIIRQTKCHSNSHKYIILKPCIEIKSIKYHINSYFERYIDFLLYIKYADLNKKLDEKVLIKYLKKIYKIKVIKYGNHTKQSLLNLANKSKYVIYYSFYDTGALSLIEMKIMGVWPISHQEEFIEPGYGSFIKELDTNINSSLYKLNDIYKIKYNPYTLSQNAMNNLNCVNSLNNIVNSCIKMIS